MTANSLRPCRSVNPEACPYHGAMLRMDAAVVSGDVESYLTAKIQLETAAEQKLSGLSPDHPYLAPWVPSCEYSTQTMTNDSGVVLHRIRAIRDIPSIGISKGDLGGWVSLAPLSSGRPRISEAAWVYSNAQLYGNASLSGHAIIYGNAKVFGDAQVSGWSHVYQDAQVYERARVSGGVRVAGSAQVYGNAQLKDEARVYGNAKVSGNAVFNQDGTASGNDDISGDAFIHF